MKRIITMRRGEVGALASLLNVTPRTIYNALRGYTKGDTTMKIRKLAIERGALVLQSPEEVVHSSSVVLFECN